MSSKYTSCAFEVQQVHSALKAQNLATPEAFDCPTLSIPNERRQNELVEILRILKAVCDTHNLPLAQTWEISPLGSYVCHEKIIKKICSSFNTRCTGKVCMFTAGLPFHVQDLEMWQFREACREQHLKKSMSCAGRALLTRGSCFCGDVTKLSEEEYPLVHNARLSHLTCCLAVFLHCVEGDENDYVLEFFLRPDIQEIKHVLNVVQTLKQGIQVASGFEMGDVSSIEFVGPPTAVSSLSLNVEFDSSIEICSTIMASALICEMDSEPIDANVTTTNSAADASSYANVSTQKRRDNFADAGETSNNLKQSIKSKMDSLTLETVQQRFGSPMDKAVQILGGK